MIRLKNRFGKANRKEMSWMSDLMETLRQEGISPDLLRAVEEYRAAHALPEALRPRIPVSGFTYHGREVREVRGLGRVNTLKFSCQLVNDVVDSFEEGSEFFVWISDDGNKVPVFLESPLRVGSVRARLVEYGGLMYDSGAL